MGGKPISEYLRTLSNKRSKIVKTQCFGLRNQVKNSTEVISYVTLAVPLKAKDACCRQKSEERIAKAVQ